jgi:YD repeat-containing protein
MTCRTLRVSNGSYTYDANGNTLSDPAGKQYSWDFEDRLTSVTVPGTGTTTYRYDPFGRRIQKSSPTWTGSFVYDGHNLIETVNSSGAIVARYTQTRTMDEPLAEPGAPAYRRHNHTGGAPSFACFSRRVGSSLIAPWALQAAQVRNVLAQHRGACARVERKLLSAAFDRDLAFAY